MRRFAIGIVTKAIKVIYCFEKDKFEELDKTTKKPTSLIANLINCSMNLVFEAKKGHRDHSEFFKIFCDFVACGPEAAQYLSKRNTIGRFMDYFYGQISPHNDFFRDMSD